MRIILLQRCPLFWRRIQTCNVGNTLEHAIQMLCSVVWLPLTITANVSSWGKCVLDPWCACIPLRQQKLGLAMFSVNLRGYAQSMCREFITRHIKCREFIFKMVTCNFFLTFRVLKCFLEILDILDTSIIRHSRRIDKLLDALSANLDGNCKSCPRWACTEQCSLRWTDNHRMRRCSTWACLQHTSMAIVTMKDEDVGCWMKSSFVARAFIEKDVLECGLKQKADKIYSFSLFHLIVSSLHRNVE